MLEEYGDIWDMEADAICITTNGFVKANGKLVMGAGVAGQAQARYPELPLTFGELVSEKGNHVYMVRARGEGVPLLSFPVKHVWYEDADLELIKRSCQELMEYIDTWEFERVLLPRPGCGNGKLKWEDVKPVIEPILDDRVVVVDYNPF